MPNLPHLCTSLELSKRLKELNVPQDSLFYWIIDSEGKEINIAWHKELVVFSKRKDARGISAYTAGELGIYLPQNFYSRYDGQGFIGENKGKFIIGTADDTEANCRARIVDYLFTSNLINITK